MEVHTKTVLGGAEFVAMEEQQATSGADVSRMSAAQKRIWFLEQIEPGSPVNLLFRSFHLSGNLNHQALRLAIDEVVRRHEILRTTFAAAAIYAGVDGRPKPIITESAPSVLPIIDLALLPLAERDSEVAKLRRLEARQSFDLSKGPLYRTKLLRLTNNEHVLLLSMHKMIADEES